MLNIQRLEWLSALAERAGRAHPFDLQLFASAYDTVVLTDTPQRYYRLDDTSGTSAADTSTNNIAAAYLGTSGTDYALNWTPGPIVQETQGGYQSKNTNASHGVSITALTSATTAWSIEGWFYLDTLPAGANYYTLWGASGSRRLLVNSTGNLYYQGPGTSTSTTALSAGAWHHVVVTSDNSIGSFGQAKFYIDGTADATVQNYTGTAQRDWNVAWYVGQYDTSTNYKLVGKAARVAIYNTALSGARVAAHHTQGIAAGATVPTIVSYAGVPNIAISTFHATSGTVTLPHAPTAGNALVVAYGYFLGTGAAVAAPTPATFVAIDTAQTRAAAYIKTNCANTDTTLTLNFGGSTGTFCSVTVWEVASYNTTTPVSAHSSNSGSTTLTPTSPSITPAANCLPFVLFENGNFAFTGGSLSNAWTQDGIEPSANVAILSGHGPATTGAAIQETCSLATTNTYQSVIFAIAPAAGGGGVLTASPSSVTVAKPGATATSTFSAGTAPYTITTAPGAGVATATIASGVVTVTGVASGTTSLVVSDSLGATGTLAITVDAAMTASPSGILVGYNAGAQYIIATKVGYNGALSATSSNTAVATVSGSGNGPTQTFQVVRITGTGGSANITISAADGDSVVVPVTYEGPLTINSISQPTAQTVVVNLSEASYSGAFAATVLSGPATPNVPSAAPTSAGGTVSFTFTWPAGAAGGESTIQFADDHGGVLGVTLNIQGPLVVSATTLTFASPGELFATTLTASETADTSALTAITSDATIATVAVLTSGPGAGSWKVTPVASGTAIITVSDGAQTQAVAVTVNSSMSFAPSAAIFNDPMSAPLAFTISNGLPPFTLAVSPVNVASATLALAQNARTGTLSPALAGTATLTVTDSQGQTITVPVTVGAALSLNPNKITFLGVGGTAAVNIVGGNGPFTVASSNTSVATIAGSGPYIVTAAGLGATVVTVTDADGETATASVVVQPPEPDPSPTAASDVRVTIYDAKFASVLVLNAASDFVGAKYEDQPGGCAAGTLASKLTWEQVYAKGTYTARNGVEIHSLDDYLRQPVSAGATKLYVGDTRPYDTAIHPETPQLCIDDGIHYTARIPVTGVGADSTGPFITIGAPLAGGGNPTTLPAYGSGALIFRRRWAGRIVKRDKAQSLSQKAVLSLAGMSSRIGERICSLAFNTVDVGPAIYAALTGGDPAKPPLFPDLVLSQANFPTVGTTYSGKRDTVPVASMVQEILQVVAGDTWVVRVGHDRTPRLLRLYQTATNTYTYNVNLPQNAAYYYPFALTTSDQDASQMANAIEVTGDTNPATNQPAAGIVGDRASIDAYLQIDGPPTSVTGLSTDAACAAMAKSILNQRSQPTAAHRFVIQCLNDYNAAAAFSPIGLQSADALDAIDAVTITGFNSLGRTPNLVPDSNLAVASQTWRVADYAPGPEWLATGGAGAFGTNSFRIQETTGSSPVISAWAYSQTMTVPPGAQISLSATFNALLSGSPGGITGVSLWIYDPTLATSYGHISGTFGQNTRPVTTVVLPPGVTQIVLALAYTGTLVANATTDVSAFDLRIGPNAGAAYADNVAAPNIYGLPSAVTTTITPGGDRFQEVSFAAIEPDWNAQLAELANGIATSLQKNTATATQIDSYCLSTSGGNYSYNAQSLALAIPQVKAIFAPGTIIQTVPAQTITLAPNATTWVWLPPSLSWLQQTSYASMPGMILLGYFTTNAVGIIGDFPKAPIGVVGVGTGNLTPPLTIPAPVLGAVSKTLGATSSQVMGDLQASVEVTNVPQDQAVANLAFYYRESGATPAANWTLDGEENLAGVPYPALDQAVVHQYAHLAYGKVFDLAVAFEGVAGYGPSTQFAAAYAMPTTDAGPYTTPSVTAASWSSWVSGVAALAHVSATFTESDFTTVVPVNIRMLHIVMRQNGDLATNPRIMDVPIDPRLSTTGTYTRSMLVPVGGGVDLGVYYEFTNGKHSATVWPSGWNNIADPNGAFMDSGNGYASPVWGRMPSPVQNALQNNPALTGVDVLQEGSTYKRLIATWASRFNSDGSLTADSSFLKNQISLWTGTTDFFAHFFSVTSSTQIVVWLDNGTSGGDIHFTDQSGGSTTLAHAGTSSGSPGFTFSGLTSGATYYFLIYYKSAAWQVTISAANTPFTYSQVAAAIGDSAYSFMASKATNNSYTAGAGTTGGYAGGTGGGRMLN